MKNDAGTACFIVTRPGEAGASLCRDIEKQFGSAAHFPAIAFTGPEDMTAFQQAIEAAGEQDWLIFNSAQAVIRAVPALRSTWPVLPERVKFAAVGAATAAALKEAGYLAVTPGEWSSEGLLAMQPFKAPQPLSIMIIRGLGGRELLEKELIARGANVKSCIAYHRVLPDLDTTDLKNLIRNHSCRVVIAGSFETITNLKLMVGENLWPELAMIPLIVMSERIKKLAEVVGFQTIWVTKNASQQAVLDLISDKKDSGLC